MAMVQEALEAVVEMWVQPGLGATLVLLVLVEALGQMVLQDLQAIHPLAPLKQFFAT